jgi:hypothetical protein
LDAVVVAVILVGTKEVVINSAVALPGEAIIGTRAGDAILARRAIRLDGQDAPVNWVTVGADAIGVGVIIVAAARIDGDDNAIPKNTGLVRTPHCVVRTMRRMLARPEKWMASIVGTRVAVIACNAIMVTYVAERATEDGMA